MHVSLLALLLSLAAIIVYPVSGDSSACVAKCPYETLAGWTFIPYTDSYGNLGTACDYYAPCTTQGLGYHTCSYWTNGTLDAPGSFGEACGPGDTEMCPASTRVYCPPAAGVSCTVSCPSDDGAGNALVSTSHTSGNSTLVCLYSQVVGTGGVQCSYYPDTGSLALDKTSGGTCAQNAPKACATSTTTATPTPTPTPTGTCKPRCPDYAAVGGLYISQEIDNNEGALCEYPTSCSTQGLGYHYCQYNMTGNLTVSGGETCGITGEICASKVNHIYCSPPPGVTCNVTCPPYDAGHGYFLIYASYGSETISCDYGFAVGGVPRTFCSYWPDSGAGAGLEPNCVPTANVVCTTSAVPTPTAN